MNTEIKTTPVWKKPEFWITTGTSVAGLLLAFGVVTPDQADSIGRCVSTVVGAVVALLGSFRFVETQHKAKVEVFRALCAMQMDKQGQFTAQGVSSPADAVIGAARNVGL